MVEVLIRTVGPGRDYEILADFAAAVPPSLVALDQRWIAEVSSDAEDPGGAVFRTTCDATRYVEVRAAPGEGYDDFLDADSDPLTVTPGEGALIRTVAGDAIRAELVGTQVRVRSMQIVTEDGAALADDGDGVFVRIERCLIDATGSAPAATVRGSAAVMTNCCVIQRGAGNGVRVADAATAQNCTTVKPDKQVADGLGFEAEGSPGPELQSCLAFGFRQAYGAGFAVADSLVSDQTNYLAEPTNLADPYWIKISSTVDSLNTIPGPYNIPLQRTGNNLNSFSRFQASVPKTVQPGEALAFSAIVAQPTTLVSALFLNSPNGNPELRVTWTSSPPAVGLLGQTSAFQLAKGEVTDLGNNMYRLLLVGLNTTANPIDAIPILYVTRGVENAGLLVDMYAGNLMAGCGNLGTGFVFPDAVPGTNVQEGIAPADAIQSTSSTAPDLRPVVGGPLEGASPLGETTDAYFRVRKSPDTVGAASLNTGPLIRPATARSAANFDSVRLIDSNDVLNAQRQRTVLPATQSRRIGV